MTATPPPSSRWPAWALFLIAAVGVPGAAALALSGTVTQKPWLALGLAIVYETIVLVMVFAFKVWDKVQSRLVDRAADAIDAGLQRLLSGYRASYLRYLVYTCRDFDVKGLTTQGTYNLELQRVFVELRVDSPAAAPRQRGPGPSSARRTSKRQSRHLGLPARRPRSELGVDWSARFWQDHLAAIHGVNARLPASALVGNCTYRRDCRCCSICATMRRPSKTRPLFP